jgi:hypothetical protein
MGGGLAFQRAPAGHRPAGAGGGLPCPSRTPRAPSAGGRGPDPLLLLTGARLGEIQTLRWEWIDWERQQARLPDSKTGVKTVYLAPPTLAVLQACGPQTQGLVLPGIKPGQPMAHPQKVWRRLCQRAQVTGVRPHDLRHTYGSMGATLGLSLQMGGKLLGHADPAMTQRYAHLAPDPVQQAAELVGEALRRARSSKVSRRWLIATCCALKARCSWSNPAMWRLNWRCSSTKSMSLS